MGAIHLNSAILAGKVVTMPELSHESHGLAIYSFYLACERLSAKEDIIPISCSLSVLGEDSATVKPGNTVVVEGDLRSFNNKSGNGNKLVISVFAKSIMPYIGENRNYIVLGGVICKPPVFRNTPLGREICDIMLAVNRKYHKSDYIPCIAWGVSARAYRTQPVGSYICFEGRIQSREYVKLVDNNSLTKTAYEVSVIKPIENTNIFE